MKISKLESETYYLDHPKHSYAIMTITSKGDFMVNSDWGFGSYAWRSCGSTLNEVKDFLSSLDEGYFKGKMQHNFQYMGVKKIFIKKFVDNLWPIFQDLQKEFKFQKCVRDGIVTEVEFEDDENI